MQKRLYQAKQFDDYDECNCKDDTHFCPTDIIKERRAYEKQIERLEKDIDNLTNQIIDEHDYDE